MTKQSAAGQEKGPSETKIWQSLSFRLSIILILVFLPFAVASYLIIQDNRTKSLEELKDEVGEHSDIFSDDINRIFDGLRLMLSAMALNPLINNPADTAACDRLLAQTLAQHSNRFDLIAMSDSNGESICSAIPPPPGLNNKDRAYFQRVLQSKAFSVGDFVIGRNTGLPELIAAQPILGDDGQVKYVLFAALKLNWQSEGAAKVSLPEGIVENVVDGQGHAIEGFPTTQEWVSKDISGTEFVKNVLAIRNGTGFFPGLDGIQRYNLVSRIDPEWGSDLYLVVGIDFPQVEAQLSRNLLLIFLAMIFFIIILIGSIWLFIYKAVISSLHSILPVMIKIRQGNFSERISLKSSQPEFQTLATTINLAMDRSESDIVQLHLAKQAAQDALVDLQKNERLYRTLTESSPECIKLFDLEGKLLYINEGGRREHSLKPNDPISEFDPLMTIVPEDRRAFKEAFLQAVGGRMASVNVRHKPEGSDREACLEVMAPVTDEKGKVINVYGVSTDISQIKQAEFKIKELSDLRAKFLTIVSHQLRTPLNAIRWNLENMLEGQIGKISNVQKEFLKVIYQADLEVISRIGDMLTAMDIEEGRIKLEPSAFSIEDLYYSVHKEFEPKCKLKEMTCVAEPPKSSLPQITGDMDKIRQMLEKLWENAVVYTPEKGSIKTSLALIDGKIRFEIRDTGIGIPLAEQSKIFHRFFRASNAAKMLTDASGLSLSLVKAFAEMHGGTAGFSSVEGQGSSFWIEIPVHQ